MGKEQVQRTGLNAGMKIYRQILLSVVLLSNSMAAVPASAQIPGNEPQKTYLNMVEIISRQIMVDPSLISAMIYCESGWKARARSPKGALGLMQLMPATARNWGVTDPFDPYQNILAGARHVKYLLELLDHNVPLTIAAYHAGEERILRDGTIPAIKETQDYVKAVQETYEKISQKRRHSL